MVIDTSAIIAIFLNEPERSPFLELILQDSKRLISAAAFVEASMVLETRLGPAGVRELDLFLHDTSIEIVAVDWTQAERARFAYRKYGKGRHPAGLNFGDCFVYALASIAGEPVLAKGDEFKRAGLNVC